MKKFNEHSKQHIFSIFVLVLLMISIISSFMSFPITNEKADTDAATIDTLDPMEMNSTLYEDDYTEQGDREISSSGLNDSETWWIYPELQPYQIFSAPVFDWDKCWSTLSKHIFWSLEGSIDGEIWYEEIPGTGINLTTDILNLGTESIGENGRKVTLNFTAIDPPGASGSAYYRFSFAIDYRVKEYINRTDIYQYTISYEVDNETFDLVFDWSDYINSSLSDHSHVRKGVTSIDGKDCFYFRVISDNPVIAGTFIELDPTYTVFSGSSVTCSNAHARNLVRQSNGTLWCAFSENADIHVAWSEDNGTTWDDLEVYGALTSLYTSIAVDSNDVIHLVFISIKSDPDDTQLEYSNSTDWTTIVQIRDEDKTHSLPSIAVDSNDNLHIVYEKGEEGISDDDQVAYINSTDNGGSWGTEQILTDESNPDDDTWFPSIAINSSDAIHVVFMCEDHYSAEDDILHMQSDDYGDTWTDWEDDPVYQDPSHIQNYPCIAVDDNDKLHVVWFGLMQHTTGQVGYSYNDSSGWNAVEWVTWDPTEEYQFPSISVTDNDYIHSAFGVYFIGINHSVNDTTSWTTMDMVLSSAGYAKPNLISAQYPIINGLKTNRPKTGYAFICTFSSTNITYYASSDLTWDGNFTPSTIKINFAGNLSDKGGPYWRPPGETVQLAGAWSDGYYTNASYQSEDWIYINTTVNDTDGVANVWLNWLNETTWTNLTYAFSNTVGDYWEYNTSGNIQTCEGYNYSFDIVAIDTIGSNNLSRWNKTGVGGTYTRRYVQLNCTPANISYVPLYPHNYTSDSAPGGVDRYTKDRLKFDHGTNGNSVDIGYLDNTINDDAGIFRYCSEFVGFWFGNNSCVEPIKIENIYFHTWNIDTGWMIDSSLKFYYKASRGRDRFNLNNITNLSVPNAEYVTESDNLTSFPFLSDPAWVVYAKYLMWKKIDLPETAYQNFTDNDIYELLLHFAGDGVGIFSNRSMLSFMLINVPENDTLNSSYADSDNDGLSDWTELYVTYTSPFLSDTDNDNFNDFIEYQYSADPNNYTDYPDVQTPTVITNASTLVEETNATLHGYLSSNGSVDTTCYFLLNDTNDFGSPIFNLSKGVIANQTEFSNDTAGETTLANGTLYYFDTKANNSVGWNESGGVQAFLTKPNAPSSLNAQSNGTTMIYINWSVGSGANSTYVERNASGDTVWERGDGIEIYNDTGTQHEDSGLVLGITYYYQAWSYTNWSYNPTLTQWSDANASNSALTETVAPTVVTNASTGVEEYNATLNGYLSDDGGDPDGCMAWFEFGNTTSYGTNTSNQTGFSTGDEFNASIGEYTYYFNDYDVGNAWETFPERMIDGGLGGGHSSITTLDDDLQILTGNTYNGNNSGTITKVELRTYGHDEGQIIQLVPFFNGSDDGDMHNFTTTKNIFTWSSYFDITNDTNAPSTWTWDNITNLDCKVYYRETVSDIMACSQVDIRVTTNINLTPGTLYHYRAAANNSNGTSYGSDMAFLTKPLEPTGTTVQINSSSVLFVNWTKGTGANLTYVERNTTSTWARGDGTLVYNGSALDYEDTGLDAGTKYYYRAWSFKNWTYNPTLYQFSDESGNGSNTTNNAPVISNPIPSNGSSTTLYLTGLNITIAQTGGASFNWTIETSPDIGNSSANNENNGTKNCTISGLQYSTNYTWYVNATDSYGDWTKETYWFIVVDNTLPAVSSPSPSNQSTIGGIGLASISVLIQDGNGDTFNWSIDTSPDIGNSSAFNETNGTKNCTVSGLVYGVNYTWWVNVTDSFNSTNVTYWFIVVDNTLPAVSSPSPSNQSTIGGIGLASISVLIQDGNGDTFNWSIDTSPDIGNSSAFNETNGTKNCTVSGLVYGVNYTWWVNVTDSFNSTNVTYWFIVVDNTLPAVSSPNPSNRSASVDIGLSSISVLIQDANGDTFNWSIDTSPDIGNSSAFNETNGTKTCTVSGLQDDVNYTWWVNVTDGYNSTNVTYWFIGNITYVDLPYDGVGSYDASTTALNITWTRGNRSDREIVVQNNDTWATNQTDGWVRQNSTNTSFNASGITAFAYFTIFSYNETVNMYSYNYSSYQGLNIEWGAIEINVFDEDRPWIPIVGYTLFITNGTGTETYYETGLSNPTYLSFDDIPFGTNTIIQISNASYQQIVWYVDIFPASFYNYTFYLPPVETGGDDDDGGGGGEVEDCTIRTYTDSVSITNPAIDAVITLSSAIEDLISVEIYNQSLYGTYGGWLYVSSDDYTVSSSSVTVSNTILDVNTTMARVSYYYEHCEGETIPTPIYYIRVVESYETDLSISDIAVEGAKITFQRYINTTDKYENISILLTDANGYVNLYLIPGVLYKVIISKNGYVTKYANYQPAPPNEFGQTTEKIFRIEAEDEEQIEDDCYIFYDYITFTGVCLSNNSILITYADSFSGTINTQIYVYEVYNGTSVLNHTDSRTGNSNFNYYVTGINKSRTHYAILYFNHSSPFCTSPPFKITIFGLPAAITVVDLNARFTLIFGHNPLGWSNCFSVIVALICLCSFGPFNTGFGIITSGLGLGLMGAVFGSLNPLLIIAIPLIIAIGIIYMLTNRPQEHV